MTRFLGALVVTALVTGPGNPVRADDAADANAVLEKAIKAMGGAEKLGAIHAVQVKTKGTINFAGNESPINGQTTIQGFDHYRLDFEGEFGGNKLKGTTIINGDKAWRKLNDEIMELDGPSIQGEKRLIYLQHAVSNPTVLTGKGFKITKTVNEQIDGKASVGVTATGPDGKEFTVFFDKESGLPVKLVAKVTGLGGEEVKQETTYADFKDFGGIKRATKTASMRDGEPFLKQELIEFKVLDKVDPKTFDEPK